jgi:hypothetical protein
VIVDAVVMNPKEFDMVTMPEPLTLSDYGRLNAMLGPDRDSGEEAIRAALRTAAQLQHLQTMRMVFADRTGETFDPAKVTRNLERLSGQDLSEGYEEKWREELHLAAMQFGTRQEPGS